MWRDFRPRQAGPRLPEPLDRRPASPSVPLLGTRYLLSSANKTRPLRSPSSKEVITSLSNPASSASFIDGPERPLQPRRHLPANVSLAGGHTDDPLSSGCSPITSSNGPLPVDSHRFGVGVGRFIPLASYTDPVRVAPPIQVLRNRKLPQPPQLPHGQIPVCCLFHAGIQNHLRFSRRRNPEPEPGLPPPQGHSQIVSIIEKSLVELLREHRQASRCSCVPVRYRPPILFLYSHDRFTPSAQK